MSERRTHQDPKATLAGLLEAMRGAQRAPATPAKAATDATKASRTEVARAVVAPPLVKPIKRGSKTTSGYAPSPTPPVCFPNAPIGPTAGRRAAGPSNPPRKKKRRASQTEGPPPRPNEIAPIFPDREFAQNPLRANRAPTPIGLGEQALTRVRGAVDLEALRLPPEASAKDLRATEAVVRRVNMGAEILRAHPEPDETGYIVGFDFGTSCTKIVVHQLGAGDLAYALPVPESARVQERGVAQEHLWRSAIWFDNATGAFSLEPVAGAVRLEGFKTGLIQAEGHRMVAGVTHLVAATAYLTLLIAYVIGNHRLAAPPGFDREMHFSRFHFGVPVACKEEAACIADFSLALTAAFDLAPEAIDLDETAVRSALARAKVTAQAKSDTPFLLFEELAGVIAGYKASRDIRGGPHVVVDVGASTLDVATFNIPPEGDEPVPVYMSAVDLLGADALEAARRKEIPDEIFSLACNQHTRHVITHTFLSKNARFLEGNGVPKPLLFVGGGRRTDVHDRLYKNYPKGLEAPLLTPLPNARPLCDTSTDFSRLLVAWGLSQEDALLPRIKPPSEIEDYVQRYTDYSALYIDKDLC